MSKSGADSLSEGVSPDPPTMAVATPCRAQVTAWLFPLPPGTIVNEVPMTVSPVDGSLVAWAVRSIERLPTTTT